MRTTTKVCYMDSLAIDIKYMSCCYQIEDDGGEIDSKNNLKIENVAV